MSVTSSLDSNLFLQVIVVLLSMFVFTVILEGFGCALLKIVSPIVRRWDKVGPSIGFIPRIFLGGLFYTLVFLGIGLVGLLTKELVLLVSMALPVLVFLYDRRWRELHRTGLAAAFRANKYIIFGTAAFGILTFIFWFRPTTGFDGLWYHLTVPKLFLQNHDVQNQGELLRYSLQPSMDYFWNLWPLSLPVSTAVASIIISGFQALMVGLSLAYATVIGKKVWGWSNFHQCIVPVVVGFTYEGIALFGGGGGDLLCLAYGLVATLYCFYILTKPRVTWSQLTCGLLLIVGLATIKVFTTVYASLLLIYLLAGVWNKLPDAKQFKKQALRLVSLLVVIFVVAYLPWLLRAYIATGRPLDPLGSAGLADSFYADSGGGTALNHWTSYVYTRLYDSIGPMLFYVYSPLVLVGVLAICNKTIRAKATSLWLLSFLGFWVVFIASIALQWRYYLPQATVLVFLGVVTLIEVTKKFDVFGRLAVWFVLAVIVATTGLRIIYTAPSTAFLTMTDATMQGVVYVRHFTNINDYLKRGIPAGYNYVQEESPSGLKPTDKIFVANSYKAFPASYQPPTNDNLSNIHNLAYIKNPILEATMDAKAFENVETTAQFVSLLKSKQVSYVILRRDIVEFCTYDGIRDPLNCGDPKIFKKVMPADKTWNVTWYKIVSP